MAVNNSRSMNADLRLGIDDGTIKVLTPDRGGSVEVQSVYERAEKLQPQYSIADHLHSYAGDCQCPQCY